MKTLEALYQEVLASDELKKALAEAAKTPDGLTQWVRAQDCDATAEEIEAFLKEKQEKASELSDDELATAAGGCNTYEAIDTVISLGFGCIGSLIASATGDGYGEGGPDGQILCHDTHP